ncbi:MAG: type VI secretion system contractile sheath large subunit [Phycisphaerales bacterium]
MAEANEQAQSQVQAVEEENPDVFIDIMSRAVRAKTDAAQAQVEFAVREFAKHVLAESKALVPEDAVKTMEAYVAELDERLTEQINQIIHHPNFQQVEGSWRGLHHLVNNTETDEMLKIRVLNVSKKELSKTLRKFKGTLWDQSPMFKAIYEHEFGMPGGEPYGCLIGDYDFDNSPPDVELLGEMAQIAAAAHAPFFAAAAPSLANMESWQQLGDPRDITKIFQTADYAAWRSLREADDAKYIGLTMPRFLSRLPYGAKTNPVEEFAFEETTDGSDHGKYTWSNASYAMGVNINKAFKLYGWCTRIRGVESGGMVEGLPCHTFPTDDGGVDMKCPTEIAITDRREAELAKNGLIPLSHWKNTDYSVFIGAQSLHKPAEYDDPDATANANLGARLPYMFAASRFGHFLKCIVRDKIGSFKERSDMEKWLNRWVQNYVEPNPETASEEDKARKPLAAAEVQVLEVEGNPGYYTAKIFLRPHYQLEGLTVSLRLVSKLPSVKGA